MKGVSDQLNNDIIDTKNDIENESPVAVTVPDEAEDVPSPVIQDAFDYQPPSVEAPEPPAVNDMPAVEEVPALSEVNVETAEEPAVSIPEEPQAADPEKTAEAPEVPAASVPEAVSPEKSAEAPEEPAATYSHQPVQQPVQQQTSPGVTYQYYQYAPVNPALVAQQNTSDGFAVASLICGIVGLVSCCTVVPSFLALIFGAISKAKSDGTRPTGVSTAGLIMGIIGIIENLLVLLTMFAAG